MTRLHRQASPLIASRLAAAVLTFTLPLALARQLDPAGFGSYKQLFLVAQTVLLTAQLGLTQSLYYFLPREQERRGVFFTQAILSLTALAIVAGFTLWLVAPSLALHLGDGAIGALRAPLALFTAGLLIAVPLEAGLTSEGRTGLAAVTYALSEVTRAAILVGAAIRWGLDGVAWGAAAYAMLRVGALLFAISSRLLPIARPNGQAFRRQLRFALPVAGAAWLWVAQKQFAAYAIAARFDSITFALFAVATFHLPAVDIIYAPIGEVLMVRLGRHATDRARRLAEWRDAIEKLAMVLLPGAVLAWLVGPTLLTRLFTARYSASAALFLIASCELPLWIFPVDNLLRASGETRFLLAWSGGRVLITSGMVVGGIALFGIAGAVGAIPLSEAISRLVLLSKARRVLQCSLGEIMNLRRIAPIAIAALLALAPAWTIARFAGGFAGAAVAALIYVSIYVLLLLRRIANTPIVAAPTPASVSGAAPDELGG